MLGYQDWVNGAVADQGLAPANRTASANGTTFDTAYTDGQLGCLVVGTVNVGTAAVSFQESDDDSAWSTVALCDTATLTTAFAAAVQAFNVFPTKRYVRVVVTGASSPDNDLAAVWIGRKKHST